VSARVCKVCGLAKPDNEWHQWLGKPHSRTCADCTNRLGRESRAAAPVRRASWACGTCHKELPASAYGSHQSRYCLRCQENLHRERTYGVTADQFDAMMLRQAGCCAICQEPMGTPAVDHDHDTGRVRGLLCRRCNTGIGMLADDPDRLLSAAAYLLAHQDLLGRV
jgi:hypothetical protein